MPTSATYVDSAPAAALPRVDIVLSKDGTRIGFERVGSGSLVLIVDAALCHRGLGPSSGLAKLLAPHFTVITYDRRGRGASGDTAPYAVEREVEDIEALIVRAGGSAYLWGQSSGAILALEAAKRLPGVRKLAIYEPPVIVDSLRQSMEPSWAGIDAALAAHDRGAAVKRFLQMAGVPGFFIGLMRLSPMWPKLKAMAHTLPYDGALLRDLQRGGPLPAKRWAGVAIPTLVMTGARSDKWMDRGNRALANVLPSARYQRLEGQTHVVKPGAHAPVLIDFFAVNRDR